ncbi:MAG TPA: 2-amino-4-hydroxy-6-hydroxymethyldihydropteridine diphosphokinase [Ignavibacteriaceae bacterium]|nr:2-amino-4-hydroxy-6-hydroxymethyldihydropteridine diphosphokinase [Ignavibacteriaceae bacterium]HRN24958.1 2-amino-4-hydroxy-6-hydroxymethyldihydropteridine diphosphokinase [Ignavibacteriaceae bacterium]HRP94373.1 2-amino-4-hydroxy-6-hydroxymethyldihydropteridine diphosphokinase [Ignavibacteriaceae bacterium]HRQ52662.1 2-amino-4-hydroxy-6-hydroxymethyldihydropteridine diphosphokinase [Ignavibacteriaceae bacterium]
MNKNNLNIAFIGIGSNVGNRINNIKSAIELINKLAETSVEKVSSIYETMPFGDVEQNNFLNAVIEIFTAVNSKELFTELKNIEQKLGRIKREKWGPREIDLDILLFNDLIISDEIITLPHKGIIYRDFVMIPLIEIEPELIHPVFSKKIFEFVTELKTKNIINKLSEPLFTEEKHLGIE